MPLVTRHFVHCKILPSLFRFETNKFWPFLYILCLLKHRKRSKKISWKNKLNQFFLFTWLCCTLRFNEGRNDEAITKTRTKITLIFIAGTGSGRQELSHFKLILQLARSHTVWFYLAKSVKNSCERVTF